MRNDLLSFITAGGLPGGFLHPAFNDYPEVRDRASELFRVPFKIDGRKAHLRGAQLRLDKMKEAVKFYRQESPAHLMARAPMMAAYEISQAEQAEYLHALQQTGRQAAK